MSAEICIDLGAVKANWTTLNQLTHKANCAAAVKANAYGLGLEPVVRALSAAGCDTFFVALTEEGVRLRNILPATQSSATIYVLNGPEKDITSKLQEYALSPVLNSLDQIKLWKESGGEKCALHLDTGMARLGLCDDEINQLKSDP